MSAEDLLSQFPEDERGLPEFAWPGGYTMAYVTDAGDMLCGPCANAELAAWQKGEAYDPPAGFLSFGNTTDYPDTPEHCDSCGVLIAEPLEDS